jgi:hypothetical protein
MRIVIEYQHQANEAAVHIDEADNLRELSLESRSVAFDDAATALENTGLGSLPSADHAWLAIDQLRQRSRTATPSWDDSFDAMIGYASAQGWVDSSGTSVRAHCVWTEEGRPGGTR